MGRPLKLVAVISVGLILILITLVALRQSLDPACSNTVLSETTSPDGRFKAVVFSRDCGATVGFNTQVSVIAVSEVFGNEPGNIFIADTNHGAAPAGLGGGPEVRVSWPSKDNLSLAYHLSARVFRAKDHVASVAVSYEKIPK